MRADPKLVVSEAAGSPSIAERRCRDAVAISDLHLGAHNCLAEPLTGFLEEILRGSLATSRLVTNGDAFDSLDFRRLRRSHWKILHLIRRLSTRIEVTWIAGNHDGPATVLSQLLGVGVTDDCILESGHHRILVCPGHVLDEFLDKYPLLTVGADWSYFLLQRVDRTHRVARLANRATKVYLRCQERIARGAVALARQRGRQMVICGHVHQAVSSEHGGIAYRNSGCWTERPPADLAVSEGEVEVRRYNAAGEPEAEDGPETPLLSGGPIRGASSGCRPLVTGSIGASA